MIDKEKLTARGQATTCHEAGDNGIPCVLLLPVFLTAQLNVENMLPQTPKLPPVTGAGFNS